MIERMRRRVGRLEAEQRWRREELAYRNRFDPGRLSAEEQARIRELEERVLVGPTGGWDFTQLTMCQQIELDRLLAVGLGDPNAIEPFDVEQCERVALLPLSGQFRPTRGRDHLH
jgi:hypothetical protein